MRPWDYCASNLKKTLYAFELAIHELTAACLALNRETQGGLSTRSARPSRSYACLGGGGEENAHRVLLMTASSQRGEIHEKHYVFGPMDMQPAAYQYGFFQVSVS